MILLSTKNKGSEGKSISPGSFLGILFGLTAILAAIYFLHLEENLKLLHLFAVVYGGFSLYNFLPTKYRLKFLFLLNIAAIIVLLGIKAGSILLVIALVLFTILNSHNQVRIV